jgi:hypothetical protein
MLEPFVSQLQMLNTMNFVWAFNFDHAINPETKEPIPVDLWAYHKVRLVYPCLDLVSNVTFVREY